jgi:hypothetical protein
MKEKLTKRYSRKLSYKYASEEFSTELVREVEYTNKDEFLAASEKLAAQVKALTTRDLEKHSELLKEAVANGDAVRTEESTV